MLNIINQSHVLFLKIHLFHFNKFVYLKNKIFQTFLFFFKVEDLTNQLANYFLAEGYIHGDVIALMLDNSIEYPCVWIALSKIGCITALINSNLRATPFLHSIRTVNAKGIITSKSFLPGKYFLFFKNKNILIFIRNRK